MKFNDMPYTRVPYDETVKRYEELETAVKNAQTPEDAMTALRAMDGMMTHIQTMSSLAYIHSTKDTTDEFYAAERDYYDEVGPKLAEYAQRLELAFLQSPHRAAIEKEIGTLFFSNLEIAQRTFSPAVIEDLQEENKLTTEYQKLMASAQIEFDGKTLTLAQLSPYHRDPDRAVRRSSLQARADWMLTQSERLDSLFDELVKIRARIADKLGYKSFTGLGYDRMTRNCYGPEEVARFRETVQAHIVPVAAAVKARQAARIGLETDRLTHFDDPFEFPGGNPKPIGTPEDIFAHGKAMYHELSPDTAEFIDFMLENELFDVLTRKGKAGGGYCTALPTHKSPFIFANFNGTSDDIDVLTHEAGHAFAYYLCRDVFPMNLIYPTYESCEVHSMSMEFFAWPYLEGFFGPQTGQYRFMHLAGTLTFLPYGTMVDEFQHIIYENPGMTPKERNEAWLGLEARYRPWLDNDFPFYREGRRWQAQSHIYEMPFYYIDYCLAQAVSLAFWSLTQKDAKEAWSRYMRFASLGGKETFTRLVELAGMPSAFGPDALREAAWTAAAWLEKNTV
ncbi:MAG: M3 family oligoendopeptidase [Oscillospiraceae bacterium]|nr:M3 family oligoendopeptidase [Oscillospiraceae bacterium]